MVKSSLYLLKTKMEMVSLKKGISQLLADVQDQAEWNGDVEEVTWMIISPLDIQREEN